MRRILLASPIRLGCRAHYLQGFADILRFHGPDISVCSCIIEGQPVNFARNEIAHYAIKRNFDEVVMVDDDMGLTRAAFERMISFDVEIVGGVYAQKRPGVPKWNVNLLEGCEVDDKTQLCEVAGIGAGFLRVKTGVFRSIAQQRPELEYVVEGGTAHEFFPMGVVGPRTPRSVLAKVAKLANAAGEARSPTDVLADILLTLSEPQPPGVLTGEDNFFCALARECGHKVFADFTDVIPHIGDAPYPLSINA